VHTERAERAVKHFSHSNTSHTDTNTDTAAGEILYPTIFFNTSPFVYTPPLYTSLVGEGYFGYHLVHRCRTFLAFPVYSGVVIRAAIPAPHTVRSPRDELCTQNISIEMSGVLDFASCISFVVCLCSGESSGLEATKPILCGATRSLDCHTLLICVRW